MSATKTVHHKIYPAIEPTRPELSAAGRSVFITGGGAGIGAAAVRTFAEAGATNIAITGRRTGPLASTKASVEADFPKLTVSTYVADVLDVAATNRAFSTFASIVGKIDILIHNAGYLSHPGPLATSEVKEWWTAFEINVLGSLHIIQAFMPHAASDASVVFLTTAVAHVPSIPTFSGYTASKAGAQKVWDVFQAENPALQVVSLHPGVIMTEMQQKLIDDGIKFPQDEMSLPAATIVWAASKEAEFVKGKFVYANWDVEELKADEKRIRDTDIYTIKLGGWPFEN